MVESTSGDLKSVYKDYCGTKTIMEGKAFAKMAKDTKLIDKKLTGTDVDLVFAKAKGADKTVRGLSYAAFMNGIKLMADKKGVEVDAVIAKVAASKGPILTGTKAEANKFHDDKSLYTGVHAKGGPSTVDTDKVSDISQTCDRSGASVRGVMAEKEAAGVTKQMGNVVIEEKKSAPKKAAAAAEVVPAGSLKEIFNSFSAGQKTIDGKTFAKVAKDCKVLNKAVTTTDIDLIFAKVKDKTERKITYPQFQNAIELCAQKRKETPEELTEKILAAGGPKFAGTKA